MLCLFEYTEQLLELNREPLTTWDNQRLLNSFAFGLIEELIEFSEAKVSYELGYTGDTNAVVKEAGDVLAYVVLLLVWSQLGHKWEQLAVEVDCMYASERYKCIKCDPIKLAGELSGKFKRYYRENANFPFNLVVSAMENIMVDLRPHDITLEHIADVNISKLKDRANRGVMFSGSVSNN